MSLNICLVGVSTQGIFWWIFGNAQGWMLHLPFFFSPKLPAKCVFFFHHLIHLASSKLLAKAKCLRFRALRSCTNQIIDHLDNSQKATVDGWNPANQLRLVVYFHYLQGFIHPSFIHPGRCEDLSILVGGCFPTPFEKYARHKWVRNLPQVSRWKYQQICELPPPMDLWLTFGIFEVRTLLEKERGDGMMGSKVTRFCLFFGIKIVRIHKDPWDDCICLPTFI